MSKKEKTDITRLEELSAFEHLDDEVSEEVLSNWNKEQAPQEEELTPINDLLPETDVLDLDLDAEAGSLQSEILQESPALEDSAPLDLEDDTLSSLPQEITPEQKESLAIERELQEVKKPIQENFKDVAVFAESMLYGNITQGHGPHYGLVVRDINTSEQRQALWQLLGHHGLTHSLEKEFQEGLKRGAIIINHLSEYSAIYLANEIKKLDLALDFAPSDFLHPTPTYQQEGKGKLSKTDVLQNQEFFAENKESGE